MTQCVVLAGDSEIDSNLTSADNSVDINNKALLQINGFPMIQYIITALDKSQLISEIVVVGNEPVLKQNLQGYQKKCNIISSHTSGKILDNLLAGVDYLNSHENVLVVTSDIPLVTAEAIDDFLCSCDDSKDFFYPVIPKEVNEDKFPGVERTYVTLADGSFTGGNVFYLNPKKIRPCYNRVERVIKNRKNPLLMAVNFGVGFVGQLLLGKLSLQRAEQRISQILDISAKVIISEHPELGIDIDKSSDLQLVNRIIKKEQMYV